MQMASERNLNYGLFPQSFCNQNVVSFQNGMVNSTSIGMIPVSENGSTEALSRVGGIPGTMNASCSMVVPMNSNMIGTSSMIGSSNMSNFTGLVVDSSHLKGSSISTHWSQQELTVLRDGLARHGHEQSVMKYIKIAARLPEKTVRDVAIRCQWMMRRESTKRRKSEEYYVRRKSKATMDPAVESTLWAVNYPENVASNSSVGNSRKYSDEFSCGEIKHRIDNLCVDSEIDCAMREVLEENNQLLSQIANNIATSQIQSNIELFDRTHKNINIMLQSINQMPGVMNNMPPIPVSPNEQLANYILPNDSLANAPRTNQLNEELQGW